MNHVKQAALIGADVMTAPPATLKALVKHPLTDKGLEVPGRLGKDRPEDRLKTTDRAAAEAIATAVLAALDGGRQSSRSPQGCLLSR